MSGGAAFLMFLCAAFCAVIAIKPRDTWHALAGWQFKNPEGAELRDGVYVLSSVCAGLSAVALTGLGIGILVTQDERECERILAELAGAAGGVDFDRSTLQEIEDDFEARWDFETVAARNDVELVEGPRSVEVVAEDGTVLGTIDEDGVDSRCG